MRLNINHEHYFEASYCRIDTARRLYKDDRFSAAIYFAGVAIESLLRAYITRKTPKEFDERHDIRIMFKHSGLDDLIAPEKTRIASSCLTILCSRWDNLYRYTSDKRLRAEFKKLKHDRGIKGDHLKENTRQVIEAAFKLHELGVQRWTSKKI